MTLKWFGARKEDRTQTSVKRTRCIWEAINVVCEAQGGDFDGMDLEAKQVWLTKNWKQVIDQCVTKYGREYANLNSFNAFVVSNGGTAVLYCEKKTP